MVLRSSSATAAVGAGLWLAGPLLPLGTPPSFGSLEHGFTFMPLVAAPLAMRLLASLLDPSGRATPLLTRAALRVQPVAAAMVLASFCLAKGALAGALAAGWLATALLLAIGGLGSLARGRTAPASKVSLVAAHLFLLAGATWLVMSRLGVEPAGLAPLSVLLAALHFHFSGFALQVLIAATGHALSAWSPSFARLGPWHRRLAVVAIAGIPIIAAGNARGVPALKFLGVACMIASTLALAPIVAAVALSLPSPAARRLLLASAASIAAAMLLAAIYGVGELTGAGWIGVHRMVATHGLLNGVGFTLCGLLGHLVLRHSSSPRGTGMS